MDGIPGQLLLQVILILLNAFFAGTEIAVLSLNGPKLRKQQEAGDKTAGRLLRLVEEPAGFLSTIQIGITLAGFLGSAFAADNFSQYLVRWVYEDLGFTALSVNTLDVLAVIVITLILSYFTLVFGELVPKRIAMQKPYEVAKVSCRVVSAVALVMKPVVKLLSLSTNGVLRLLRLKTEAEEEAVTEEEIRMMVELGQEKGTIDEEEKNWIQNVFEFDDLAVTDSMTRIADVQALSVHASAEEIWTEIQKSRYSRYPVYDEDIDDIIGILTAREFLVQYQGQGDQAWKQLLRPAYLVPETIHADRLFKEMQQKKLHMAIVISEYGETIGIITMEDLLEEIVGNIYDELDPVEPAEMERQPDGSWRMAGSVTIKEMAAATGREIPESDEFDTLAGMVLSCLTSIPEDGSRLEVETCGFQIEVVKIEDHRIEEAIVRPV